MFGVRPVEELVRAQPRWAHIDALAQPEAYLAFSVETAMRPDGTVIPGLYAAGNASAAVMGHSYTGAGATLGPAMTFGYVAANAL